MLRKRLVEPTVAVVATPTEFKAEDYRHCKPDTLVILGGASLGFGPLIGPLGNPPYYFAPTAGPPGSSPLSPPPPPEPAVPQSPANQPQLERPIGPGPAADAKLDVRVSGPERATVHETKRYQVTVINRGGRPLYLVGASLVLDRGLEIVKTSEKTLVVPGAPPVWPDPFVEELPPGGSRTRHVDVRGLITGKLAFTAKASANLDPQKYSPAREADSTCTTTIVGRESPEAPGSPPAVPTTGPRLVPVPRPPEVPPLPNFE
jgi:hypothetical protein